MECKIAYFNFIRVINCIVHGYNCAFVLYNYERVWVAVAVSTSCLEL